MQPFLSGRHDARTPALKAVKDVLPHLAKMGEGIAPQHHHGAGGAPVLECVKEGDRVVRIIVTCGCGERIEIDCLYPAG